jgi:hypothetical protein
MKTYKNQSDSEQSAMTPEPLAVQASKPTRQWWHWHEPGTSKEEKWLIFKLDAAILTYTCLVWRKRFWINRFLLTDFLKDLLCQISGSNEYHECLCIWNERGPEPS